VGWRSAAANTDNTFSFFNEKNGLPVMDNERSNRFAYTEAIHAVYAQFNKKKGNWSYQGGLRLEQTDSRGELTARDPVADKLVRRSYLNLFPSAGFTYQLHPQHQVGMTYSRRIDRPSYQDLNPFENRLDELTYQKGNPFLRPQFTHNIELKHSYKYKWNSSLGFSDVSDFFAAITDTVEGRRNFIMQRNIAHQRIYSFNTSLPFRVASWWNVFASAGVNHSRYRAQFEPGKEIRINATVANVYQQHSFSINKKWSAEVSSFWLSPYVWAGTYECRSIWNIDAGVQRKILNDQGTIKLTVTDIFRRMPWEGVSRLGVLRIDAAGGWESRLLRLNFSWRFGNREVKNARQRSTGLEDLNRRVQ
jgi:outer membrane receptor protein involved in Fe transport